MKREREATHMVPHLTMHFHLEPGVYRAASPGLRVQVHILPLPAHKPNADENEGNNGSEEAETGVLGRPGPSLGQLAATQYVTKKIHFKMTRIYYMN